MDFVPVAILVIENSCCLLSRNRNVSCVVESKVSFFLFELNLYNKSFMCLGTLVVSGMLYHLS